MRISYVPNPPPPSSDEDETILKRIQARRAPHGLQSLDLALLHSFPIADGWNSFLGAIRTKTSVDDDLRELAICRIAICNKAWYEWIHHSPLARQSGVSDASLDAIKKDVLDERPEALSAKQWAVLLYTDEITRTVQVKDKTFENLNKFFDEKGIVELTATIACYNCVSRFQVALNVGETNGAMPDVVSG
ncbi:hypothetical protein NM208_g561 [Fusarium decemcellulare]|uniref:Uncharacterized protein n=2 Tax=Fusarium decemcellulare TaxID=57161 RepID=A0ACC1SYS8_9HYPO|nr:hypothetical protein NM208_g752 [Fusarium decemcellulare]KAJ3549316.1 hypothetical protein NM208_g561 [Fusarium decemcellulare]